MLSLLKKQMVVFIIKNFKRIIASIVCSVLLIGITAVPTAADDVLRPIITVSSASAIPGDTIVVDVSIAENPGIMAMTFTLAYDKNIFEFKKYRLGVLNDYLIVNHADKGYVSFVNCDRANNRNNGTIFAIEFTVKDNAQVGTYDMKVMHIRPNQYGDSMEGCFANWKGSKILPTINNGTVSIGYTGTNCAHKYGDWVVTVPPLCETVGVDTHTCSICGHSETRETDPVGHKFQDHWTVDRIATENSSGLITRHCDFCDATTDKVTFTTEDARQNGFSNTLDANVTTTDWKTLEEIITPDIPTTPNTPDTQPQTPSTQPEAPTEEPESPKTDNSAEVDDQDFEPPLNADELITAAKQPMGLAGRLYRFFFGTQSQDGALELIGRNAPDSLQWIYEYRYYIIAVILITLI